MDKKKKKKPTVWQRVGRAVFGGPSGPSKAEAKPKKDPKMGEVPISEFINWGGQYRKPKK